MTVPPYDRRQFLASLKRLAISQTRFGEIVETDPGTIYHWGTTKRTPFPGWVPLVLAAWEDNKRLSDGHGAHPDSRYRSVVTADEWRSADGSLK